MDSSGSLHSYESESEFDIALREAKGARPRTEITPTRIGAAYTPLYDRGMNPAGINQGEGNRVNDQEDLISQAFQMAEAQSVQPAGVGSSTTSSSSVSQEEEDEARQRLRRQMARGKRPAPRTSTPQPSTSSGRGRGRARGRGRGGRPSRTLSGTTTTSLRLPARRPRRPLVPPAGLDSGRVNPPPLSPIPRDIDDFDDPDFDQYVDDDLPEGDDEDMQQLLGVLMNDVQSAAEGRQIKGITTTNTITTVYKGQSRPTVRRNSTRVTNP